jgi:hypothetical protein
MTELEKQVAGIVDDFRYNPQTNEECAKEIIALVRADFLAHPKLTDSPLNTVPSTESRKEK